MTKEELVRRIRKHIGGKFEVTVKETVDLFLKEILEALSKGEAFQLIIGEGEWEGAGQFEVTTKGISPLNAAKLNVPRTLLLVPDNKD